MEAELPSEESVLLAKAVSVYLLFVCLFVLLAQGSEGSSLRLSDPN
jgi:hypothetical protein